jgi:sugar phosphate isomerase/epimerase
VEAAPAVLEEASRLGATVVLQNHAGTAIESAADYATLFDRIGDPRLGGTLEVGHFLKAGIRWEEGYDALRGRVSLVHLKDMRDRESVEYGEGEVDFGALFRRLKADGYRGPLVIEYESNDMTARPPGGARAVRHLRNLIAKHVL